VSRATGRPAEVLREGSGIKGEGTAGDGVTVSIYIKDADRVQIGLCPQCGPDRYILLGKFHLSVTTDSVSEFAAVVAGQAGPHPAATQQKSFFLACMAAKLNGLLATMHFIRQWKQRKLLFLAIPPLSSSAP
jgi:hypothetical protein